LLGGREAAREEPQGAQGRPEHGEDALDQQQAHETGRRQERPARARSRALDTVERGHEAEKDGLLVVRADAEGEGDRQELHQPPEGA
jgi:hypothetical protein